MSPEEKTVTVLVGNEILSRAIKKVLQAMGCRVRTEMGSCGDSDFAVIGAFFLSLGVVNQVRSKNPSLPLVLIDVPGAELNGYSKYFYGVIHLDGSSQMDAIEKIEKWFTEEPGKFLISKKGDRT